MNKLFALLVCLSGLYVLGIPNLAFSQAKNENIGLVGRVTIYNEFGQEEDNKSGVKVTVLNDKPSTFNLTDKKGHFLVKNITEGRHRVLFTKSGYGSYQTVEYNMLPGPLLNYGVIYKLGKVSSTVVFNLSTKVEENNIVITGQVSPAGTKKHPRYREYFFGKGPNVSKDNHVLAVGSLGAPAGTFKDSFTIDALKKRGFKSGETVYMVAHGNTIQATYYINPVTKKSVYPALNDKASNVTSFVLP